MSIRPIPELTLLEAEELYSILYRTRENMDRQYFEKGRIDNGMCYQVGEVMENTKAYFASNFIGNYIKSWYQFDEYWRSYAYWQQGFEVENKSFARLVWIDFMLLELEELKLDLLAVEVSSSSEE
jgi:hypothetical protein